MAYIAYPIDQNPAASMASFFDFMRRASDTLKGSGLVGIAFDPGEAFSVQRGTEVGPEIEQVNMFAQSQSDLTIAFLPAGVPTIGVPIEIARAASRGMPVVVFTDTDSWSLAGVTDRANVFVGGFNEDSLESAIDWLEAVDNDEVSVTRAEQAPLPVRLLGETSRMPSRGYKDDAGLDLYVSQHTVIPAGEFRDVPCGVAVQLPEGTWGMLTGRSSTLRERQLLVHTGIIDVGYRGPLFAGVWNLSGDDKVVTHNDRIAQLIVLPNVTEDLRLRQVKELGSHERGEKGFGSTGA